MTPIGCVTYFHPITNKNMVLFCWVFVNDVILGLPLFYHYGNNYSYPSKCNCNSLSNFSSICDDINLMVGILIYQFNNNYNLNLLNLIKLLSISNNDIKEIYNHSYYASYYIANNYNDINTFGDNLYDFCKLPNNNNCSIITINSYDTLKVINEYNYRLTQGNNNNDNINVIIIIIIN